MKRFPVRRWNQILIWTAAALAWGTALIAAKVEPARIGDTPVATTTETSASRALLPDAPPGGLVVLRYTPVERPASEIQKAYVERPLSETSAGGVGSFAPAPVASPPSPSSSGS